MKFDRKTFLITELILAIIAGVLFFLLIQERRTPVAKRISVILQDSEDDEWDSLRYGMREAADDYGVKISFASTGDFESIDDENDVILEESWDSYDGMILYPVFPVQNKEYTTVAIPTMIIGSSNIEGTSVTPDYYGMGSALGEEIVTDYAGNLTDKTVGILVSDWDDAGITEAYQGLTEKMERSGYSLKWIFGQNEEDKLIYQLTDYPNDVDIIIALDNRTLEIAGELSANRQIRGAVVYGIGYSSDSIYYLDTEAVRALVIPDYFQMGYLAVEEMAEKLTNSMYKLEDAEVSYRVLRQKDVFLEENRDIMNALDLD